jgi:hypothetical protein
MSHTLKYPEPPPTRTMRPSNDKQFNSSPKSKIKIQMFAGLDLIKLLYAPSSDGAKRPNFL